MLNQVVRFSLTQRLFVCVLAALVVALGIRAWLLLPVDAYPDISPTQVKVILKVPGMTAEEIEQQVTYPVETELLGIIAAANYSTRLFGDVWLCQKLTSGERMQPRTRRPR